MSIEGTFHLLLFSVTSLALCLSTTLYPRLFLFSPIPGTLVTVVVFIVIVNCGEDVCVCVKGEMVAEGGRCQSPSPSPSHCPRSPRGWWAAWIRALYTLYRHMYDSNTTILWRYYVKSTKLRVSSVFLNLHMCSSYHIIYVRSINDSLSMISLNHYLMSRCPFMMPVRPPSCEVFSLCRKRTS